MISRKITLNFHFAKTVQAKTTFSNQFDCNLGCKHFPLCCWCRLIIIWMVLFCFVHFQMQSQFSEMLCLRNAVNDLSELDSYVRNSNRAGDWYWWFMWHLHLKCNDLILPKKKIRCFPNSIKWRKVIEFGSIGRIEVTLYRSVYAHVYFACLYSFIRVARKYETSHQNRSPFSIILIVFSMYAENFVFIKKRNQIGF